MNLAKFDQKYVRLRDIYRETFIGMAVHHSADYCYHEYAVDEEALQIGDCIIYASQIASIEVGLSIVQGWWGRGFATEALTCVLHHLTENEGIDCVTAWCAAENIGSRRAMEKAGMQLVATEKEGLVVGDQTYDKLIYEYRKMS